MNIDIFNTILGILAFSFGIYTFYARSNKPEKLIKLAAMKKLFGEQKGNTIHLIAYSFIPVIFGIMMLLKSLFGISL